MKPRDDGRKGGGPRGPGPRKGGSGPPGRPAPGRPGDRRRSDGGPVRPSGEGRSDAPRPDGPKGPSTGRPAGGAPPGGGGRAGRGGFGGARTDRGRPAGPQRPGGPSRPDGKGPPRPGKGPASKPARPPSPFGGDAAPEPAPKRPKQKYPQDDASKPSGLELAKQGDFAGFEDLLSQAIAPIFDLSVHLFGAKAEAAAEDALYALLIAVRKAEFLAGDPLKHAARTLVRRAKAEGVTPFTEGLDAGDMLLLALDPTDGRGKLFAKLPPEARLAVTVETALDLGPRDLAYVLECTDAAADAALKQGFAAVPSASPKDAMRDILDTRAAAMRLPFGLEDRLLDRLEAAW